MENLNKYDRAFVIGDHHGDWLGLYRKLDYYGIENCYLFHVGDGGEGWVDREKQIRQFEHCNNWFKSRNIYYMSIRGNHSDPAYFLGQHKYSNYELLPDYSYRIFRDKKILFVGGAVSIDRRIRTVNKNYWLGEKFILKPEEVEKCDILITHSAPSWVGKSDKDGIQSWCDKDETLWDECVKERLQHNELIELCSPEKHFAGHFHEHAVSCMNGCDSRILDIMEPYELYLDKH